MELLGGFEGRGVAAAAVTGRARKVVVARRGRLAMNGRELGSGVEGGRVAESDGRVVGNDRRGGFVLAERRKRGAGLTVAEPFRGCQDGIVSLRKKKRKRGREWTNCCRRDRETAPSTRATSSPASSYSPCSHHCYPLPPQQAPAFQPPLPHPSSSPSPLHLPRTHSTSHSATPSHSLPVSSRHSSSKLQQPLQRSEEGVDLLPLAGSPVSAEA
jgi:hypothetical protein